MWVCYYESELKRHFITVKKFLAQKSVKKVILIVCQDMKGPIIFDFLEKVAIVSSASYHQLLRENSPHLLNDPRVCIFIYIGKSSEEKYEWGFGFVVWFVLIDYIGIIKESMQGSCSCLFLSYYVISMYQLWLAINKPLWVFY